MSLLMSKKSVGFVCSQCGLVVDYDKKMRLIEFKANSEVNCKNIDILFLSQ